MEQFDVVWRPTAEEAAATHTQAFMDRNGIGDLDTLLARSISDPEWFWPAVIDYLEIPFAREPLTIKDTSRGLPWTTWFGGGQINLSEVCVDRWALQAPEKPAVVAEREDGTRSSMSYGELHDQVGRLATALERLGVLRGDAVAVFLPMSPQAVVSFLAAARLGAVVVPIFSGFGAEAVAARLSDPKPKALICADGIHRRGHLVATKEVADEAAEAAGGLDAIVVVDYAGRDDTPMTPGRDHRLDDLIKASPPGVPERTTSEEPVLLAYTSGTTGRPKAAVHVHGGFTVKVAAEGAFQTDVHQTDTLMWLTDMGWIMGPWMVVAGLANGACIATYDGAPDYPDPGRIWAVAESLGVTILGLSPTLARLLQPHGVAQARAADLSRLRLFGSTGEPWNPGPWHWLFDEVGEGRRPIVNISGGTEIGACILSVNLLQGIKPTSLGGPALGMAADVADAEGRSVRGEVGELVIRDSWPGMTRGFWGEPARYLETYWSRYPDVWVHGDWASVDKDGFWFLHGRSDDTLNIAGKRIGPAELESAAVSHPQIVMAAAVGVPHEVKGEAIAVYVVPIPGVEPTSDLAQEVSDAVVATLGKAFRPEMVRFAADLPRTRSAKIMRRVIKAVAMGQDPGDLSSLENPSSLEGLSP